MADDLLSIRQFARISGLSVGALRHYDELDLLRPADPDPFARELLRSPWLHVVVPVVGGPSIITLGSEKHKPNSSVHSRS